MNKKEWSQKLQAMRKKETEKRNKSQQQHKEK